MGFNYAGLFTALFLLLQMPLQVLAQKPVVSGDTSLRVDLLRAPVSPSAVLLNMAPSDIEKPTDITAFMFSVRSATNSFTAIPSNYAVELAPFQLFKGTKPLDSRSLVDNKENFRRSFVLSLGVKQVSSNDSIIGSLGKTQLGFGIGFALKRSDIDATSKQAFENIWNLQHALNDNYADIKKLVLEQDPEYIRLTALITAVEKQKATMTRQEFSEKLRPLMDQRQARQQEMLNAIDNGELDTVGMRSAYLITASDSLRKSIAEEVKKIRIERSGFNMDFNSGGVVDFLDNTFNQSSFFKVGAWVTGGWNKPENNFSGLFIVRYLYTPQTSQFNPELNTIDSHNLDFGGRVVVTAMQRKLMVSGEGIYRSVIDYSNSSSWRLMLNAAYDIGINQKLTFSFGRNFDGAIYKGGNIIGAINLLFGLGSQMIGGKG